VTSHPDGLFRKARKIAQWSLAYLASAWVLVQVVALLADQFQWPAVLPRAITVALGVGFFAVLILAWYHGERGQQGVTLVESLLLALVAASGVGLIAYTARPAARAAATHDDGLLPPAAERFRGRASQLALDKSPRNENFLAALAHVQAKSGQTADARRILVELESRTGADAVSPFFIALVYAGLGDVEQGMSRLEKSVQERAGSARYLIIERRLAPLRQHPRYRALMEKFDLAKYAAARQM
jgi:hypothetical protein